MALVLKTTSDPFGIAIRTAAQAEAKKKQVHLTIASGSSDGDAASQIQAVENAISRGDQGILIAPVDTSVNAVITKARKAGIDVIAFDTVPNPANIVNITVATDNRQAGELIGQYAAARLGGAKAVIGLVDAFNTQVVSVDYDRDQGFLQGMGIPLNDPNKNADEAKTGHYSGGRGGEYEIVGNQPSNGNQADGRTATETLLAKNRNINVIYAVNEPASFGAYQALKAAGKAGSTILVTLDGSCSGLRALKAGAGADAEAQQFPSRMGADAVDAIVNKVRNGKQLKATPGLNFFNTGTALITDKQADGVKSISSDEGLKACWGK